jgi:hypothetical protein
MQMKQFSLLLLFFSFLATANAQGDQKPEEKLEFKQVEIDFGKIAQNKPVYDYFEIFNKSNQPVKISNVIASCGCTTPEWDKEAIEPGKSTKIKVGYNAASGGPFEKSITINYDDNQAKVVKIKGEVVKAPEGAAPPNASIQFLKKQLQ